MQTHLLRWGEGREEGIREFGSGRTLCAALSCFTLSNLTEDRSGNRILAGSQPAKKGSGPPRFPEARARSSCRRSRRGPEVGLMLRKAVSRSLDPSSRLYHFAASIILRSFFFVKRPLQRGRRAGCLKSQLPCWMQLISLRPDCTHGK